MSVLIQHFILDSGLSISASVSDPQRFPSLLRVCEEAKCLLEKLINNLLWGRTGITPSLPATLIALFGKSLSKESQGIGSGFGWALLVWLCCRRQPVH